MTLRLEDTLEGGYNGLYGEVVTEDTYHLRSVAFQPDIVFDVGANVGIFSRFARELFPKAIIIAVEPNPKNCQVFRLFTPDTNTTLLERALGKGKVYHGLTARNGSGETYLSAGLGYPKEDMDALAQERQGIENATVRTVLLSELLNTYWHPGMKALVKIDCEGAENCIWEDNPAIALLKHMDYLAMELHFYALTGPLIKVVQRSTMAALHTLNDTHDCKLDGVHFWATKKL